MFEEIASGTKDFLTQIIWGTDEGPDLDDSEDEIGDNYSVASDFSDHMSIAENRKDLYSDYEDIAKEGLPSNVLEIYADDAVGHKLESGRRLWVEAEKKSVQEEANKMLNDWGIRNNLWRTLYYLMLFGDYFYLLEVDENEGIENVHLDLHPIAFRRWEKDNQLIGFEISSDEEMKYGMNVKNKKNSTFIPPWNAIHFRTGTSVRELKKSKKEGLVEGGYGSGLFESNLADLKKLNVAENALVVSRYQNQRRPMLMFINAADHIKGKKKQKQLYQKIKRKVQKNDSLSKSDGFDSLNDLFSSSEMVTLPHSPEIIDTLDLSETVDVESIADIEYIRDRVMGNFKVPNAFLGLEEKLPSSDIGQSSLISISTRYARSVRRKQAALILPLRRMLRIHFALQGTELASDEIAVHTKTLTTAEDLTEADRAKKIASSFSSITQLFGRGPLEDVELDQEKFASFVIDSLGFDDMGAEDILKLSNDPEEGAENTDEEALEAIDDFLGGSTANSHRDQNHVPSSDLMASYEDWKVDVKGATSKRIERR